MVLWDDTKENPPEELKVSPIAMILHKSRVFRAMFDHSFSIRLASGYDVPSVNDSYVETVPSGAIDQLGYSLMQVIPVFAQAGRHAKIYGRIGHQRWFLTTEFSGG